MQVITKMRKNQKVRRRFKKYGCNQYFNSYQGWGQKITIRGRETKTVIAGGARLYVPSHHTKRFVIAMRYEGDTEYRFIESILESPDPKARLLQFAHHLEEIYPLRSSKKHFNGVVCETMQKVA